MNESGLFEHLTEEGRSLLKIMVLYEDVATRQQAESLLADLPKQVGIESGLAMKLWRIDLLSLPLALEQAAAEAVAADIILLAVKHKMKLSVADREWINRWLDNKEDRPYLFCLLLDEKPAQPDGKNPLIAEMEQFTSAAGVDFFCGTAKTPVMGGGEKFTELHERASRVSNVLDGILNQELNHRVSEPWRHAL